MTTHLRRLTAIANGQLGSFSRQQAHAAGISDDQLRRWVESGVLVRIGPHAFRLIGADTTSRGALQALVLDVGEPCWVSGPTAAALFGLDGFVLQPPFHLTVRRDRNVRRIGHFVHSTSDLPLIDRETLDGIPVTSPSRTIIDIAGDVGIDRLTAAVDAAFRDGLSCESLLRRRAAALRVRGRAGIPMLLDVLDGGSDIKGGHSWLEREFLRIVADAGLPRPDTQVVLTRAGDRVVRVDCRFPGTNLVVELLGYRWHRSKMQMAGDAERLNALALDGFAAFQFTYDHVVEQPTMVVATVRAALRSCEGIKQASPDSLTERKVHASSEGIKEASPGSLTRTGTGGALRRWRRARSLR